MSQRVWYETNNDKKTNEDPHQVQETTSMAGSSRSPSGLSSCFKRKHRRTLAVSWGPVTEYVVEVRVHRHPQRSLGEVAQSRMVGRERRGGSGWWPFDQFLVRDAGLCTGCEGCNERASSVTHRRMCALPRRRRTRAHWTAAWWICLPDCDRIEAAA